MPAVAGTEQCGGEAIGLDSSFGFTLTCPHPHERERERRERGGRPAEHRHEQMAGGERASWCVAALVVAVMVATANAATSHVVGGSTAWTIPPNTSFYSEWASTQTFAEGDKLVFNFPTGIHNVIEVPKSGYDACSAKNQIGSTHTTGPTTVTISSSGTQYYICGVDTHCSFGQKLSVTVAASAPSTPPSKAPPPAAGGPTAQPPPGTSPAAPEPTASGPSGSGNGSSFAPALASPGFRTVSLAAAALSLAALLL